MSKKISNINSQKFTLGAVAALLMLAALDQTIVTTALPAIVTDLGNLNQLSWVVTAYLLTSTISAPIYGKLGDIFGRKIMMQIAVMIFVFSSMFAALSQTMLWMLLARALQGLGGGGLFVLAFTVVGDVGPTRDRGKIQGLFAAVFGLSSILGPLAGGFFVDNFSWHWIFIINIPIGICALTILYYSFSSNHPRSVVKLDYLGATFLSIALASMILVSSKISNDINYFILSENFLIVICLVGTILFFVIETRAPNPILPLTLFRINNFRFYSVIGLLTGSILFSILTFVPFYLQVSKGISPTSSGIQIIPLTFGIIFGTTLCGLIMSKTGKYKFLPFLGSIILCGGLLLLSNFTSKSSPFELSALLFLIGLGLGPQLSIATTAIQNSAPQNQMGVATAGLTLFRQIGSSVGVASLSTLFVNKIQTKLSNSQEMLLLLENKKGLNIQTILELSEEQKVLFQTAFDDALRFVFIITAYLSLAILLLSLPIKEIPLKTKIADEETELSS